MRAREANEPGVVLKVLFNSRSGHHPSDVVMRRPKISRQQWIAAFLLFFPVPSVAASASCSSSSLQIYVAEELDQSFRAVQRLLGKDEDDEDWR